MSSSPLGPVQLGPWFARGRTLGTCLTTGDTFLVRGGLPGETVQVHMEQRPRSREARVTHVLNASPERIPSVCPHFPVCRGCDLLHASRPEELRCKQTTLVEVFKRHAGLCLPPPEILHGHRGDHRLRTRLTPGSTATGRAALGMTAADGNLISLAECPANAPALRALTRTLEAIEDLQRAELVELISGADGDALIVQGATGHEIAEVLVTRVELSSCAIAWRADGRSASQLLRGPWPKQQAVGEVELGEAVDAWMQPNPPVIAEAFRVLLAELDVVGRTVLDLTCGTGALALSAAASAASVLASDLNWAAVQSTRQSADRLGLSQVETRGGKAEAVLQRLLREGRRFDRVVINPMRQPLGALAMERLHELRPERLAYLAPAPMAAAKDLRLLRERGWTLRSARGVDLHPGTGHVMALLLLDAPSG